MKVTSHLSFVLCPESPIWIAHIVQFTLSIAFVGGVHAFNIAMRIDR